MLFIDLKKKIEKHWKSIVFLLLFLLFLLTGEILFAILTTLSLIWIVGTEVQDGVKKHGWKHEVVDTVINIVFVLIFWFALQFILNTSTPISAIVTCSMLPNLDRGDLVIVQGTEAVAYELEMSKEEFEEIESYDVLVTYGNISFIVKGSMYSYCEVNNYGYPPNSLCDNFYAEPEKFIEKKGEMTFHYSKCELEYLEQGTVISKPCTTSIEYKGKKYPINLSHDIIVYMPEQGTYFSYVGDIIHRAYFKINVEDETYYLTKGDNNPVLDIQMYNYKLNNPPAGYLNANLGNLPAKKINGKQIFRIPYIGYLKLFITGFYDTPDQCNINLVYDYLT